MRAKDYDVAQMCVEAGVKLGWNRAHKHVESPSPEVIQDAIHDAIISELCEWFDFVEVREVRE